MGYFKIVKYTSDKDPGYIENAERILDLLRELSAYELTCLKAGGFHNVDVKNNPPEAQMYVPIDGCIIAIFDEEVMAGVCYLTPVNEYGDQAMAVYNLVVDPKYRGKGYAKKLFSEAKLFAKSKRIDALSLGVLSNNTKAIKLYQYLGFKTINQVMMQRF